MRRRLRDWSPWRFFFEDIEPAPLVIPRSRSFGVAKVLRLETSPVLGDGGLALYVLSEQVRHEEPYVRDAVVQLYDRHDCAECHFCGSTVGAYIASDEGPWGNEIERDAWADTTLIFFRYSSPIASCYDCAVRLRYIEED